MMSDRIEDAIIFPDLGIADSEEIRMRQGTFSQRDCQAFELQFRAKSEAILRANSYWQEVLSEILKPKVIDPSDSPVAIGAES